MSGYVLRIRREADAVRLLSVPDGDTSNLAKCIQQLHTEYLTASVSFILSDCLDAHIKSWIRDNYLSVQALSQADNVRVLVLLSLVALLSK